MTKPEIVGNTQLFSVCMCTHTQTYVYMFMCVRAGIHTPWHAAGPENNLRYPSLPSACCPVLYTPG